jgi:hypothetical protein
VIIPESQVYRAFGAYWIKPRHSHTEVWKSQEKIADFGSTRSAISWCIADNHKQYNLAQQIMDLDQRSKWSQETISQRNALSQQSRNTEFQNLIQIKLQHRKAQKRQIDSELEKCIKRTKYLQYRGFTNDTQRTGPSGNKKTSNQNI